MVFMRGFLINKSNSTLFPSIDKSKITNIPSTEGNSKRKVRIQMANSKAQSHQMYNNSRIP